MEETHVHALDYLSVVRRRKWWLVAPIVSSVFVGLALWLESYASALLTVVPVALIVCRLTLEEAFLRRELPGYNDYADRVTYRLLPGIW